MFGGRIPICQCLDLLGRHQMAVFVAQQIFQQNRQAVRQPGRTVDSIKAVDEV